ncbi:MAG TPA: class I SAM-dependent methyltransferase [bacterium]|nr:class I SAM-dependent methyltransferase [bacterium]HOL48097.1 class I SAM-dependent methyltransferase [bacterium]HPQ19334.1 class I SAM-dependent methyltransferase [bacterium]
MFENIYCDIRDCYKDCSLFAKIFIYARCLIAPFEKIIKYIPEKGIIVDIGCGYGMFANYISTKRKNCKIVGIDFNDKRIAENKKSITNRENIDFFCCDVKDLELTNCDVICIIDLMHHIDFEKQKQLLEECYKKLSKGGLLIFKEIDTTPKWMYYCNILHDSIMDFGNKLHFRNSDEYKKLICERGFKFKQKEIMHKTYLSHYLMIFEV